MKVLNRSIKICGESTTINAIAVRVLEYDVNKMVLRCSGLVVPTGAGYAKGCLFIKTDAATGVKALYENQGTTSAASFNVIGGIAAAEVTLADGKILVGNGSGVGAEVTPSGDVTFTNTGVTALSTGKLATAKVSLTNAEIKNLRATPKQLAAAPGANKVLQFISAILKLKAGVNVLTESTANLAVKYTDGSGVAVSQTVESTGFIDQAANTQSNALPKIDAIVASASSENKALVLHNIGAGEIAGNAANDATLEVYVTYRVVDVA